MDVLHTLPTVGQGSKRVFDHKGQQDYLQTKLPMFFDRLLYTEYDSKMALVRKEGLTLKAYLK